jgi:hypothetical protein
MILNFSYSQILVFLALLYLVLIGATYLHYKYPVRVLGHDLPDSFQFGYWVTLGPSVVSLFGLFFMAVGVVFLSPFILYLFGFKFFALISLVITILLTPYASKFYVGNIFINFSFPLSIPIGLLVFWLYGVAYAICGAILLSPLKYLIFLT